MSCACDEVSCQFYSEKTRRARKPHRCYECNAPISRGDHYVNCTGKWDGDVSSFAICTTCDAWSKALREAIRARPGTEVCSCWCFGELLSQIREFAREELGYDPMGRRAA